VTAGRGGDPRIRVVIADDHPFFRDGVARGLERSGRIEVVGEAGDGREALELIRAEDPAVALVDYEMPDLDGLDVVRAVVRDGSATRVLLLIASLVESAYGNGRITERPPITGRYAEELAVIAERYTTGATPRLVATALSAFLHLSGAISGELFGQLATSVEEDRRGFFEFQMRGAAALIGMTDVP